MSAYASEPCDADPGSEMPGIDGHCHHRLRGRPEQEIVDQRLVVERYIGDLGRQCEHDMKVADGQEVCLALGELRRRPGTSAVSVAAGVVSDPPLAVIPAGLDVTAEGRGAAVLDRQHGLELGEAEMTCISGPIGRTGRTEDVGDLDRGARTRLPALTQRVSDELFLRRPQATLAVSLIPWRGVPESRPKHGCSDKLHLTFIQIQAPDVCVRRIYIIDSGRAFVIVCTSRHSSSTSQHDGHDGKDPVAVR